MMVSSRISLATMDAMLNSLLASSELLVTRRVLRIGCAYNGHNGAKGNEWAELTYHGVTLVSS